MRSLPHPPLFKPRALQNLDLASCLWPYSVSWFPEVASPQLEVRYNPGLFRTTQRAFTNTNPCKEISDTVGPRGKEKRTCVVGGWRKVPIRGHFSGEEACSYGCRWRSRGCSLSSQRHPVVLGQRKLRDASPIKEKARKETETNWRI